MKFLWVCRKKRQNSSQQSGITKTVFQTAIQDYLNTHNDYLMNWLRRGKTNKRHPRKGMPT